jgi:hypothetical protein
MLSVFNCRRKFSGCGFQSHFRFIRSFVSRGAKGQGVRRKTNPTNRSRGWVAPVNILFVPEQGRATKSVVDVEFIGREFRS